MKINQLMESRIASLAADRSRLVSSWAPIIEAAREYAKENGMKPLSTLMEMNIARCCENALLNANSGKSRLFETTDSSNVSFLGVQLPVIAALLPSLVLNELATVQALERRTGSIFYLDVTYGTTKGGVTSGQTMMSAKTGHNSYLAGRNFASEEVVAEVVAAAGGPLTKTGTLAKLPVIAGSLVISDGNQTATDNGSGVLVGSVSGITGTINYTTGAYSVTFVSLPLASTARYQYSYETQTESTLNSSVPEVNFNITNETIEAIDFPLRANYTLAAAIDLERAHGLSLEDEMVKYLGGEVKFTQDHLGIDKIVVASKLPSAAAANGAFSATPSAGETWIWKKYQFMDFVEKANNAIISKTLRMSCTWILCGNNAARLIRQLAPHFVLASGIATTSVTGPYVLGTLDGRTVIHDPFLAADELVFGYKGQNWTEAAFAYAPYIPLLTTPTLVTANLKSQKGFLSSSAYKVINAGAFCYGTVSGL